MEIIIKCDPELTQADILSRIPLEDGLKTENKVQESQTYIKDNKEQKVHIDSEKEFSSIPENSVREVKTNELSLNTKRSLLNNLKCYGYSDKTLQNFASSYSVNTKPALEYFEKAAKNAQDFVFQECDSLSFNNISEWLKYFEAMGGPKECNYEAAIILNAIANSEFYPEPNLMGGVDLRKVYRFLSYALMGLPQEQLDAGSAKFLSDEFQNLIDEANTDEADVDVRNMKRKIEDSLDNNIDGKIISESYSLDPLNVTGWNCENEYKK